MAEAKGNTAVPKNGDVDRVQMLSLNADGSPDQTPGFEMIGDKETALAQAREQFAQQAVSAVDQVERPALGLLGGGTEVPDAVQDPAIQELTEKHDAAAEAGVKAAEATVEALFVEDDKASSTSTSSAKPGVSKASTTSTSK